MTKEGASPNDFEEDKPDTHARARSEATIEDLRKQDGFFVEAVRATRMAMVLTDPNLPGDPIIFANPSFLALSGYSMEEVLGQQPYFMNGPDTDPDDAGRFRQFLREDRDGVVETVQYAKDGRRFVAKVLLSAFKDDSGRTIHHFLSWADVTKRVAAEADASSLRTAHTALRESESHLAEELRRTTLLRDLAARLVTEESVTAIYQDILSTAVLIEEADAGTVQIFDGATNSLLMLVSQNIPSEMSRQFGKVSADARTACAIALRTGKRKFVDFDEDEADESRELHLDAGFHSVQATPLISRDGHPIGMLNTHWRSRGHRPSTDQLRFVDLLARQAADLIDQRRAEGALRESGERLRLIVENARDYAIFRTDPAGLVVDWYPGAEAVFGFTGEEIVGGDSDVLFTPEDRAAGAPEEERATTAAEGKAPDVRWHMRKGGIRVFIDGVSTALRDPDGKLIGFLKIGQDVTERHAAGERQKLLLGELQHRVRNTLGMIRSMVRFTASGYDDVEDFVAHLVGRLDALARTQVLLTRAAGARVDLESLVWDELESQTADQRRVRVTGPEVTLSPKAAEVLTLALHELATNSLKYGALSDSMGSVSVAWALAAREDCSWVRLIWEERAGTLEPTPIRAGFGTELIQERVPYELNGEATLLIGKDGVRAEIAFPLAEGPSSILETAPAQGSQP